MRWEKVRLVCGWWGKTLLVRTQCLWSMAVDERLRPLYFRPLARGAGFDDLVDTRKEGFERGRRIVFPIPHQEVDRGRVAGERLAYHRPRKQRLYVRGQEGDAASRSHQGHSHRKVVDA